jgi:hypothetical protein
MEPMLPVHATPKLRLGDTEVARIGLGTNRLTNTPEHVAFVKEAVDAGVNLIDTRPHIHRRRKRCDDRRRALARPGRVRHRDQRRVERWPPGGAPG